MSRDTTLHELGFSEVNSDSQKERPRSYAGCMSHGARDRIQDFNNSSRAVNKIPKLG